METKTLNQMKGSEIYRILTTIFEVMEKAQFEPQTDARLETVGKAEKGTPEKWKILFKKKSTSIDELNAIRKELGENFSIILTAKKDEIVISIEALNSDFIAFMQRKYTQRTLFNEPNKP